MVQNGLLGGPGARTARSGCRGALTYRARITLKENDASMSVIITPHQYTLTEHGPLELFVYGCPHVSGRGSRPGIVFFFGGGWTKGTPEHFSRQATYLAERGMVAVCVDYRVKSRQGVTPDKCVQDAMAAMRWVRTQHERLGIDPERIVASGGSAGGHLAACTATLCGNEASAIPEHVSAAPNAMVLFNPALEATRPANILAHFGSVSQAEELSPNRYLRSGLPPPPS